MTRSGTPLDDLGEPVEPQISEAEAFAALWADLIEDIGAGGGPSGTAVNDLETIKRLKSR